MNIVRLQALAARLREIDLTPIDKRPRSFNMNFWACSTVACAGGEACLMPEFEAQGLQLRRAHGTRSIPGQQIGYPNIETEYLPEYEGYIGCHALAEFFELTQIDARSIFMPTEYFNREGPVTAGRVAQRIEGMVDAELRRLETPAVVRQRVLEPA